MTGFEIRRGLLNLAIWAEKEFERMAFYIPYKMLGGILDYQIVLKMHENLDVDGDRALKDPEEFVEECRKDGVV